MRFDLRQTVRTNRRSITFANITTTKAEADSLAPIYLKVVKAWQARTQRIVDSYAQTLSELIHDAPADTSAQIDSVDDQIRRLVLMLTPELRDWAVRVEAIQRGKWIRNVFSAVSIDLSTVLSLQDVADTVEASITWNVSLIKDVSDEIRRKITNSVFSGFQARKPATDLAREIREATGFARARSLRIASDQTVKLGSRLNQARQQQAGLDHYKWRHSGKAHPRLKHKERDGKIYPWVGKGSIDPDDRPGVPPFCGCTAQGVLVMGDEPTAA